MLEHPSEPPRPELPAVLRMLSAMLPPYCRDEVCGDILEQYATTTRVLGRTAAKMRLHGETLGVLLRLGALWLREHEIRRGPLRWQAIRLVRVAAKRSGVWYIATGALREAGQPVHTLRLIVYDKAKDAFLATRTREVRAGLMPPQATLAMGPYPTASADRRSLEQRAAEILAAMSDEPVEHLLLRRYEHMSPPYRRGRGGFECRILGLPVSDHRPALRPTVKGATIWAEPEAFLAAVSDDGLYARKAAAYRARLQRPAR
jgi:hypothetical protein